MKLASSPPFRARFVARFITIMAGGRQARFIHALGNALGLRLKMSEYRQ